MAKTRNQLEISNQFRVFSCKVMTKNLMHQLKLLAGVDKLGDDRLKRRDFLFVFERALSQDFPVFFRNVFEGFDYYWVKLRSGKAFEFGDGVFIRATLSINAV